MSAATSSMAYKLARAALRHGLLHVVSQRDTGALNPICAANPIRSAQIEEHTTVPADLSKLCADCATLVVDLTKLGSVEAGLALFIGIAVSEPVTARLLEIPLTSVTSTAEPRTAGHRLIASVKNNGVITPVLVRKVGRGLILLDGGRRIDAARLAGLTTVPAIVRDIDEQAAIVEAILANSHREELDPIAQAIAYQAAVAQLGVTKQALADGLGLSRSQVSNTIRLLGLPAHLREHVAEGTLTAQQGRALLACATEADQDALADAFLSGAGHQGRARGKDESLVDLSRMIAEQLTLKKVQIRPLTHGKQIVLTVADQDFSRVLAQFGLTA